VLNVLPKLDRDKAVKHIGSLLQDNGVAVITVRSKDDVLKALPNAKKQLSDSELITARGTYQKGFTRDELKKYLSETLGKDYEVMDLPNKYKMSGVGVLIKKSPRSKFSEGGPVLSSDQKMYLTFYNLAKEAGVAYPAAVAAQASLESGHGTSELATKYNNPLGIKVNRPSEIKQGQPSVKVKTQEFVEGKEGTYKEPFRTYNNLAESFVGYKEKVAAPRYDSIRQAKNEDEYLTAIANSGYATDPLYAEKTIKIKNRYANLIPKD